MDMNLQKYLAFVKTAEYGSFTKAAEMLNYSQSGISRMIHDLEQDWHVTLLERNKAGVKLTSDGTRLLPHAQSLCNEFEKFVMQLDDLRGLQSGLIRIGTFSSVATHWLPNIIKEFQKDHPSIDYEVLVGEYTEIEHWIQTGRVDCAFLRLPTHPDFDVIPLEEDELRAVIPVDHILAREESIPLTAFCDEPFMLLEKGARAEISELFVQHGLTPDVRLTTLDDYAIMSMVESGLGISILPQLILQRIPYHIVSKPLATPAYRQVGFVVRSIDNASLAVKKFVDFLPYRHRAMDGQS